MDESIDDTKESIYNLFQKECPALDVEINQLPTLPESTRPQAIDRCLSAIARLSDSLKDAATLLPAYDQRSYAQRLNSLSGKLSQARQSLAPKPKFSFKSKRINRSEVIGGVLNTNSTSAQPALGHEKASSVQTTMTVTIASQKMAYIRPQSIESPSVLLSALDRCLVSCSVAGQFSSAAIKNVTSSLLFLGPAVDGPIHLTSLSNTTVVFSCRQFRMHDAKNVDVYLHCSSRPIIEDCENIRFAPYGNAPENKWDQIDDFKWLRSDASPHWSTMPSSDRVPDHIWDQIQHGNLGQENTQEVLDNILTRS